MPFIPASVVRDDDGDGFTAQRHLAQRIEAPARRLGPDDPVPVAVPAPQIAATARILRGRRQR